MTLTKLFDQVAAQQALRPSRVKDVKTSLRYLARALGADDPAHCAADILQAPDWKPSSHPRPATRCATPATT
jgi:hypothetical protein